MSFSDWIFSSTGGLPIIIIHNKKVKEIVFEGL